MRLYVVVFCGLSTCLTYNLKSGLMWFYKNSLVTFLLKLIVNYEETLTWAIFLIAVLHWSLQRMYILFQARGISVSQNCKTEELEVWKSQIYKQQAMHNRREGCHYHAADKKCLFPLIFSCCNFFFILIWMGQKF